VGPKDALEDLDLHDIFQRNRAKIHRSLDLLLTQIQQSAAKWMLPLIRSLGIRQIVETQVAAFPLPKLEKLVLDVVSKELQMITWLGALLGGLIGLIQALLLLKWQ
jgi:uncharacterized membrane protein YheB (UPF0754 family)